MDVNVPRSHVWRPGALSMTDALLIDSGSWCDGSTSVGTCEDPPSCESTCCANAYILDNLRFFVVIDEVLLHPACSSPPPIGFALAPVPLELDKTLASPSRASTNPAAPSISLNLSFSALNPSHSRQTPPLDAFFSLNCTTHASKRDTVSSNVLM